MRQKRRRPPPPCRSAEVTAASPLLLASMAGQKVETQQNISIDI
jgi:hypothetical protein